MNSFPKLSLIFPVFNEQKRVKRGLTKTLQFLFKQTYSWELIIVDDGSTDQTQAIIEKTITPYLPKHNIYFLRTHKNFGKGHALKVGVSAATGKYIIFSDIDLSVPLSFTNTFLQQLEKTHIAIGTRRIGQSKVIQAQSKLRQSLGHSFTHLSNFVLGLNHSDLTCGFKGFKKTTAKKLFSHQRINHWAFDSEILFLAKKFKYSTKELSVTWKNDPLSKVNLLKDMTSSFFALFVIRAGHYK